MRAQGDLAEAASLHEESLDLFRALEDTGGIALVLSNLGGVAERRGEYATAASFYRESLDLYRELGEKRRIALLTGRLGGISRVRADYARAAALYEESLRLHRGISATGWGSPRTSKGSPRSASRGAAPNLLCGSRRRRRRCERRSAHP